MEVTRSNGNGFRDNAYRQNYASQANFSNVQIQFVSPEVFSIGERLNGAAERGRQCNQPKMR